MYEWLRELSQVAKNEYFLNLAKQGASDEDLAFVETTLGIKLPESYKAFLKIWNGGEILGSRIFSVDEILDYAQEWGFQPFNVELDITDERQRHYYSAKPAHHLIFRSFDFSPIVFCFDVSENQEKDYAICQYEEEAGLVRNLQPIFSNFEIMLMHDILYEVVEDPEFLVEDGSVVEECGEDLEEKCKFWQTKIKAIAKEKAIFLAPNFDLDSWT